MDSLAQDLRLCLRSLARQPGFVAVAVLSLAVGMGVNTAIFSALNTLLFQPVPVANPAGTVYVFHTDREHADRGTSFAAYSHYRDRSETFASVMAFSGARPLLLIEPDRREQAYAELVTSAFFRISRIKLQFGRAFGPDVESATDPKFATVLSHRFWKRRFASDPAIVGKSINLNGQLFSVFGVADEEFAGFDPEIAADMWIPLTTWAHLVGEPARLTSDEHWLRTIGELKDGVSLEQARAAMAVAGQPLHRTAGEATNVRSIKEPHAGAAVEILAIAGSAFAVGLLVLGLACLNVVNLLMARAAARKREMSVRMALGSGRGRLVRLWLIESAVLCAAAAALGLVLAWWMLDLAVAFKPPTIIGQSEAPTLALKFALDLRMFAFILGLCAATAGLTGVISGLQATNPRGLGEMKTDRTTDRRFAPGFNLRSSVIVLQMAMSVILLIPCGLFIRSALNASTISPGFATDNVLLLPISDDQAGVRVEKPAGFDQQLVERVSSLPGVEAAAAMDPVPLWFAGRFAHYAVGAADDSSSQHRMGHSSVTPGYFKTLRIALIRGRDFTASDGESAPQVAIINETMARRFWPGGDALGRQIRRQKVAMEIVGVVADTKHVTLADAVEPWVYQAVAQDPTTNTNFSLGVRATGDSMQLKDAIEREVRALVPAWPMFQFRSLQEGLELQQLLPRVAATLLGILGVFGLLLAAVGIYGVMAYVVKQRTQEIGIRLALGSPVSSVLALLVKQGMSVCVTGAAIGIAVALGISQLLTSVLYGINGADPLTFAIVPLFLAAVALLACYLPARNAGKVNPLEVLRRE